MCKSSTFKIIGKDFTFFQIKEITKYVTKYKKYRSFQSLVLCHQRENSSDFLYTCCELT